MNEKAKKFLFEYLNNASPVSYESAGQKIWLEYLKPYIDEWHLDAYGTAYGVINPDKEYKVVIEAHADEISWYVNYITDKGFIHVIRNGGSDHSIAPSKTVTLHTSKGPVQGVFGWPAIHTRKGKNLNMAPTLDKIFLDVGAKDKDEVLEMGVHVGTVVTFDDQLRELNNYYCGRALDNRMGGFCIAEVARKIHEGKIDLPFSLYVINAVQEEVGLKGAQMIANRIQPDCAIVTDVTHDTSTPNIDVKKYGDVKCGKGPSLTYAPAVHNKLQDLIIEAADKAEIPFQREAASRSTGTDTDSFAYSQSGVPSALISLPLRYMHTTVEMAHKDDIENVIDLILETLKHIDANHDFQYF